MSFTRGVTATCGVKGYERGCNALLSNSMQRTATNDFEFNSANSDLDARFVRTILSVISHV